MGNPVFASDHLHAGLIEPGAHGFDHRGTFIGAPTIDTVLGQGREFPAGMAVAEALPNAEIIVGCHVWIKERQPVGVFIPLSRTVAPRAQNQERA